MREQDSKDDAAFDPLAEIVRAAGRRKPPPTAHYDQVYAAAHTSWRRKVQSRRNHRWFAVAASVAMLTAGGVVAYLVQTGDAGAAATVAIVQGIVEQQPTEAATWEQVSVDGQTLIAGSRLRTAGGGTAALDLVGGGSLRIAAETEIRFGVDVIELTAGTVYFDSANRDTSVPVLIDTPFGRIRDVGTQFEVSVQQETMRVRVREGDVAVRGSLAGDEVLATLGEQLDLSAQGTLTRSAIAPDAPAWAWVEVLASAPSSRTQSVLTYFRWIARETGRQLEFESESVELAAELANFSGDPTGLSPRDLLSSIAATSDFRYSLAADGVILIGRNQGP